jgi:GNAT superfamily N-acetyltransferase
MNADLECDFRPAEPGDADTAAELIAMSDGDFGVALFGLGDPALERRILAGLYRRIGNRYSYRWGEAAVVGSQVVGLLLAVPGAQMLRLNLAMLAQTWQLYGPRRALAFYRRAVRVASFKEVEPGELQVGNLAVLPEFRGRGIARRLLARADALARRMGLARMALTVDFGNLSARHLYETSGYRSDFCFPTPHLMAQLGTAGLERMVKDLESQP